MQTTTVLCALSAAAAFVAAGMFFYGKTSFAHENSGLINLDSPESVDYLNTEWLNSKGTIKIAVNRGQMSLFFKDEKNNAYVPYGDPVEVVVKKGGYVKKSDGESPLELYWNLQLNGKLLSAQLAILDAPATYETFARAGHESDFPALPVFAKSREDIGLKKIRSLSFTIGDFGMLRDLEEAGEESPLPDRPEKWQNNYAASFTIDCESADSKNAGKCYLRYGESENFDYSITLGKKIELTDEQANKFFELATVPGILKNSPYRDSNDMMRPFCKFKFQAKFASGESANIVSNHGFHAPYETVRDLWQYAHDAAGAK